MKNKYLVLIQNSKIIHDLRALNVLIAYPLKSFSVGFNFYFDIDKIPEDGFVFINRILDNDGYYELQKQLNSKKIKGVIFDDLGVLEIVKDKNIEKILFMNHALTNYKSINIMLNFVDSIVISTDITKKETDEIIQKAQKKLVIYGFGLVNIMYSRRNLLSNYAKHYNLENNKKLNLTVNNKTFLTIENESGTVFYDTPFLNNLSYLNNPKVKYIFINSLFVNDNDLLKIINNEQINLDITDGFLNKKTIYKLKDGD